MYKTTNHILAITRCLVVLNVFFINAQTSIFRSDFAFSISTTKDIISSFTFDEHQIYFNGNNFSLYVRDKNNFHLNFEKPIDFRSNKSTEITYEKILVGTYTGTDTKTLVLNKRTAQIEQVLNLSPSNTIPCLQKNTLYGTVTGYDGGEFFAYELQNNKTSWTKFISHGVNIQPLYSSNYITLSIGDENWTGVNYDGTLKDTLCNDKIYLDTEEPFFAHNYYYLINDNLELTHNILENNFQFDLGVDGLRVKTKTKKLNTVLLNKQMLLVFKDGKKKKQNLICKKVFHCQMKAKMNT